MKAKSKLYIGLVLIIVTALSGYLLWLFTRPVEIIAVHQEVNFSEILVRNFPFSDKGKIDWWLHNKTMLKVKYKIPQPASYGNFYVNFWDFGEGYKEDKYDRRCFDDMKISKNCIDKNAVFSIENDRDNNIFFTTYNGRYILKENGKISRIKED